MKYLSGNKLIRWFKLPVHNFTSGLKLLNSVSQKTGILPKERDLPVVPNPFYYFGN